MRNNILKIIRYGIPVAAAAAVGVLYGKLPKKIPVHWDLQGNVEYGEKIQIWFMVIKPSDMLNAEESIPLWSISIFMFICRFYL